MKLRNTLGLAICELNPGVFEDYPVIHFFHGRLLVAGWLAWSGGFSFISQYHRNMFMPTREQIMIAIEMYQYQGELIALIEDGLRQKRALEPPKPVFFVAEGTGLGPNEQVIYPTVYVDFLSDDCGIKITPSHTSVEPFLPDYPPTLLVGDVSPKDPETIEGLYHRMRQFVVEKGFKAFLPRSMFR